VVPPILSMCTVARISLWRGISAMMHRFRRGPTRLIVLLIGIGLVAQAGARTKSTSYSNWRIEGPIVHLSFTIPLVETARLSRPGDGACP
jgi:hypothetical protein